MVELKQLMAAPYSLVCGAGHVLDDEIAYEPEVAENGTLRCSESGCLALVYSHCVHCATPVPGYIDGVRYEVHGNIGVPRGRLGTARGMSADREWREDCPHCKAPYPWARDQVWVGYHGEYLAHEGKPTALPPLPQAKEAFERAQHRHRLRERATRREERKERRQSIGALLDTWPKRITAVAAAIAAVLLLVFGVNSFADLGDEDQPPTSVSDTTVP